MSNGTNYAKDSQMTRRYIMLLIGIFFMGTGISLIIKSGTGTSPMSSLTNVMTQICPLLTLGMYTFLLNVLFFIGEFIVDFKSFSASKFIQLIPTFFLSVAVDFNMFLVRGLHPETYILKLAVLIIGCMVSADVILMPGEALIKIISVKYQKEYGNVKTAVDVSLVVLAVIVSLIFLNTIYGVSEGTLIAAFTIGNFSRFFRGYTNKMVREAALQ